MKKLFILFLMIVTTNCYAFEPIGELRANQIADAIYRIEGGAKTKYPYGIKSIKTYNPRQVCINTIKNNYIRWQRAGMTNDYLTFLGNRYCPPSADKQGSINWIKNIHKLVNRRA